MDEGRHDQDVYFEYHGQELKLSREYWDQIIQLAYFDAIQISGSPHDPKFLSQLIEDYSPHAFSYYRDLIDKYKRIIASKIPGNSSHNQHLDFFIPKPNFDFSSSVLELNHWYECRLKPSVSKILSVLDIQLDSLLDFEQQTNLEQSILNAKAQDLISEPNNHRNRNTHPEYNQLINYLVSKNFNFQIVKPVLYTLSKAPRHEYLRIALQCENEIIRSIQRCLPSYKNDHSEIFSELKSFDPTRDSSATSPKSLGWFMEKLSECMAVIDWNYPIPKEYFYQIDSGLIPHPKLNCAMTDPQKDTLLSTFRFHHDLLIKELELGVHKESPYDFYYRKLFYIFDRFNTLNKTDARNKIRDIIWNEDFSKETRDILHKEIVDELTARDIEIKNYTQEQLYQQEQESWRHREEENLHQQQQHLKTRRENKTIKSGNTDIETNSDKEDQDEEMTLSDSQKDSQSLANSSKSSTQSNTNTQRQYSRRGPSHKTSTDLIKKHNNVKNIHSNNAGRTIKSKRIPTSHQLHAPPITDSRKSDSYKNNRRSSGFQNPRSLMVVSRHESNNTNTANPQESDSEFSDYEEEEYKKKETDPESEDQCMIENDNENISISSSNDTPNVKKKPTKSSKNSVKGILKRFQNAG